MKKIFAMLLVLILSLSMMTGCSKSKKRETTDSGKKEETTAYTKGTKDGGLDFNPEDYVTLGEYKDLSSYSVKCSAAEDEVQEYINDALSEDAEYPEITDRGAEKGDLINFDYETTVDGKKVEDCTYEDYEIVVGENEFDKTVEKEMLGKKKGDSFEVELTLSEDLTATNIDDKAVMKVTVKGLSQEIIPELNDAYVKEKGYDKVDDFKKAMEEQVIADKEQEYYDSLTTDLITEVADNATLKDDYPKSLFDSCKKAVYDSISSEAEQWGDMEIAEYLEMFYGMTEEDLESEYLMATQERLLIYSIAQKESLFLTKEQYEDYLEQEAKKYEMTVEELKKEAGEELLKYTAVHDNVIAFLYDSAKKEDITDEEFEKMNAEDGEEVEDSEEEETTDDEEEAGENDIEEEVEDSDGSKQ